jgi:hypothetical protein
MTERITYTDIPTQRVIPDIMFLNDTIRMTQEQIGMLYQTDTSGISRHIKRIYENAELKEEETSTNESKLQKMQNTQNSFKKPKNYYNLQMIIAVGFKVNSIQASNFRRRANHIIEQYTKHGYVLDDERLKNGKTLN